MHVGLSDVVVHRQSTLRDNMNGTNRTKYSSDNGPSYKATRAIRAHTTWTLNHIRNLEKECSALGLVLPIKGQ